MIKKLRSLGKEQVALIAIMTVAFLLRFFHLGYQSFWLDELHTAIECDRITSWSALFGYLRCCDINPPLIYLLCKPLVYIFGGSEFVLRSVSAVAGTLSVWAIYRLGKEFYNNSLGLIAAAMMCVNFFSISYSQEARPYTLAALFTTLSFLFFIRLIKNVTRRNRNLYALFTILMLYSHYFGMFAFAAQVCTGVVVWLYSTDRKMFRMQFIISLLIIAVGFAPVLPFLSTISNIKSTWIPPVDQSFAIDCFFGYFGSSDLIKPFVLLLLSSFFIHLFSGLRKEAGNILERPLTFIFLICSLWIFIGFYIPFLRSLLVVPMLIARYTIVFLPAFIILLALGIELVGNRVIKGVILAFFITISLTHIFFVKKYYTAISKTQFREMAHAIAEDTAALYPVVTDITWWHQQYYLNQLGYHAPILSGKKEATIDSILRKSSERYNVTGFWLTGAHGEAKPESNAYRGLDSSFILLNEYTFFDAWAKLYISRNASSGRATVLNFQNFPSSAWFDLDKERVVAIWTNAPIVSAPVELKKGHYKVIAIGRGFPLKDVFPHIHLSVNGQELGAWSIAYTYEQKTFEYDVPDDMMANIKIQMDNDAQNDVIKQDRNAFFKSVILLKMK